MIAGTIEVINHRTTPSELLVRKKISGALLEASDGANLSASNQTPGLLGTHTCEVGELCPANGDEQVLGTNVVDTPQRGTLSRLLALFS